jgi:hypothetical protein
MTTEEAGKYELAGLIIGLKWYKVWESGHIPPNNPAFISLKGALKEAEEMTDHARKTGLLKPWLRSGASFADAVFNLSGLPIPGDDDYTPMGEEEFD